MIPYKPYVPLILIFLLSFTFPGNAAAQQTFKYNKSDAVFYPPHFDSTRMMPSLAIIKDLKPKSKIESSWKIRPLYTQENGKQIISIPVDLSADLYGNGEVVGNLRRNGTTFTTWNTDNYTYKGFNHQHLYESHPWILGVRKDGTSFGILVDNSWKQSFILGNPIRIICEGPAPRVIIIEKQSPQEVLQELGSLTGTMEMPPLWAIGFQQCRFSYFPDTKVKEIAAEFRKRQIPCDVIWMDIDYMNGFRVFTFNNKYFPDPKGLNDYLHGINFKSVFMIDPGIKIDSTYFIYQQGQAKNYWVKNKAGLDFHGNVWPGPCVFPDFTSPAVRKWWSSLYHNFMANGIDGVWNDMNEPAVFDVKSMTMPEDNLHAGGGDLPADVHLRYHNVYGMLMVKASREGIMEANPGKRPFVLSRANFIGGQRYGATWTGDNASTWDYLRMSIPMSINLSLSGQAFNGADIGGFSGDTNEELLAHWMALGVYYPFSRNHSANNTAQQEPWAFGKKVEDISRTAINRRYILLPYLYTLFKEASEKGTPIMQPVYWSDLKDTSLRKEQEVFLLGKDLMIIPRWANHPAIPKQDWDIFPMEKEDDGYQPYLALRPGAVLPLGKVIQSTADYKTDSITLLVNPDKKGKAEGIFYDDSGEGFGYKSGEFASIRFTASISKNQEVKILIRQTAGNINKKRWYRIGYVADGKILYSDWQTTSCIKGAILQDLKTSLDFSSLKMSEFRFDKKSLDDIFSTQDHQGTDLHF